MINLLPDTTKQEIRAARMNVILLRYIMLVLAALAFLALTCAIFYFVMRNAQADAVAANSDNQTKAQSFAQVRSSAEEYKNNLTIAGQILNNSVNYSSVVFSLTKLLPQGVILDGITLNASSFGQQTTLTARAVSYEKATELKDKFQKSTLLTNVYFENLVDNDVSSETPSEYPIAVTISAKINKAVQQ